MAGRDAPQPHSPEALVFVQLRAALRMRGLLAAVCGLAATVGSTNEGADVEGKQAADRSAVPHACDRGRNATRGRYDRC